MEWQLRSLLSRRSFGLYLIHLFFPPRHSSLTTLLSCLPPSFAECGDACCVSTNHDRAFNGWRFHGVFLRGHLQFSQELTVIRSDLYGLLALAQGSDGGFQGAVAPQILFSMFSIRPIPI